MTTRKKVATKFTATSYADSVGEDLINQLWECWLNLHSVRRMKLTEERRIVIAYAIGTYGLELALKAVQGCAVSEFHMGGNDLGKKYNSIELIFRDEWRVKKFAKMLDDEQ